MNWDGPNQYTALHFAACRGQGEVVKLLLEQPNIDVNVEDKYGDTPIAFGCRIDSLSVVKSLLRDPRVDVTQSDHNECTPLWWTSFYGNLEVLEWLIASGRDLGDLNKKGKFVRDGEVSTTSLEIVRKQKWPEMVPVLEKFVVNSVQT